MATNALEDHRCSISSLSILTDINSERFSKRHMNWKLNLIILIGETYNKISGEKNQQIPKDGLWFLLNALNSPLTWIYQKQSYTLKIFLFVPLQMFDWKFLYIHHISVIQFTSLMHWRSSLFIGIMHWHHFVKQNLYVVQIVTIFSPPCIC